jgi:hypothetical protein
VLDPGGLLAFKVPSGEAYVSPELGALLSTLRNTCGRVFEEVTLVPGDYIHFLASQSLSLGARTDSLAGVLRDRGIETSFVDEYHLFDRLAPLRRSELDSVTALYDTRTVNSDFRPVSASYAVARWAKHFQSGRFLAALVERASPTSFVLGLLVSVSLIVPLLVRAAGSPRRALPGSLTLYALGLTSMFTQVLIIVGFQIVSGYVYGWIAVLIASFMLGMGLASGAAGIRGLVGKPAHLPFLMAGLGGLPLAALAAMRLADHLSSGGLAHLTDLVFVGLALVTGALGGTVFALGSTLLIRVGRGVVDGGALAYALDLCGATVAGFTTAFLAIPSFGIAGSAYAIAAFNAVLLVVILVWRPLRVLTGT